MYKSKFSTESIEQLYEAILKLETVEDCHKFFEDLCTIKEIQDMSMRLDVAKLLKNKESYITISEKTSASTATISRVSKSLIYGAGGYDIVLNK
jgi:TrpR-related protein YerC/YecD